MREILFRGRGSDCWNEGQYIPGSHYLGEDGKDRAFIADNRHPMFSEVIPESVGEYTGLKDKNGVRIFEGDVVTADDFLVGSEYDGRRFTVEVIECGFYLVPESGMDAIPLFNECAEYEVVGNVWDDPELTGRQSCAEDEAVSVVFCRDCRHYTESAEDPGVKWCNLWIGAALPMDDDDFCSKGERKQMRRGVKSFDQEGNGGTASALRRHT